MTNAKARFNNSLRPRKPEGSLRRTAQDVHLDSHTAPELCDDDDNDDDDDDDNDDDDDDDDGRFYIALFSALEQTYCALVACGSK